LLTVPSIRVLCDIDPLDFSAQKESLQGFYAGTGQQNQKTVQIHTTSVSTTDNPVVVLWLHGSSGMDFNHSLTQATFEKGMAFITFSRFKVNRKELPDGKGFIETYDETWNNQTALDLASEIAMVYGVCEALVSIGTEKIILAGHSRCGILALQCAMESNAQHFRNITANGKKGSVIGYMPISALPMAVGTLTMQEPVVLLHGNRDTICDYRLMHGWYKSLRDQSNIKFIAWDFGHQSFDNEVPSFKGVFWGLWGDFGCYLTSLSGLKRLHNVPVNCFKRLCASLGFGKGWAVKSWMSQAENYNDACFSISDDGESFTPFGSRQAEPIEKLKNYISKNQRLGVTVTEVLESNIEVDSRVAMILHHFESMQKSQ
jgi:predicted esterase